MSSLAFDPLDPNLLYSTYSPFGGIHLWKSTNGGASWADADGAGATGIPDIPVHSVVVDPTNAARIYAGTDAGVFVSLNRGTTWAKENTLFPNVITERLLTSGANLYAFTHGRGAWRVPLTADTPTTTVEHVLYLFVWLIAPNIELSNLLCNRFSYAKLLIYTQSKC